MQAASRALAAPPGLLVARVVVDEEPAPDERAALDATGLHRSTRRRRADRPRAARLISTLLMTLLVGFITLMGTSGAPHTASAGLFDGPFCNDTDPGPFLYRTGVDALLPAVNAMDGSLLVTGKAAHDDAYANVPTTAYEWWGSSGLTWSYYEKDTSCWNVGKWAGTFVGNLILSMSQNVAGFSIGLYQWASSPDLLADFQTPINTMLGGLKDSLYLNFLTPIVVLGALWGAWQGLVKKRTSETMQGGLWMIGSAVFALFFMTHPAMIASGANSVISNVGGTAMAAVTNGAAKALPKDDLCYLPDNAPNYGPRIAACGIYRALEFTPWAAGQFGDSPAGTMTGPQSIKIGNGISTNDVRADQVEAQAINHDEARDIGTGKKSQDQVQKDDQALWNKIADTAHGQPWGSTWDGDDSGSRINIAIAAVWAAFAAGLIIILISFSIIVLALGFYMLMVLAPLFLLIGAHPGFGRGIALKWLEMLLSTVLKRIALAFLLSVIIGFYQIVLATPMSWFMHIAMIVAIGVGAIIYRKPLLETLNVVSLGGTRAGIEGGELGRTAGKGLAGGVGVVAGGMAASGGGLGRMVRGAVTGGLTGARSGSVARAGMVGSSAGRRVAGRAEAKQRAAERAAAEASDPFAYDKVQRKAAREETDLARLAEQYADDPEMQRRIAETARARGITVPRPKSDGAGGTEPPSGGESPTGGLPTDGGGGGNRPSGGGAASPAGTPPRHPRPSQARPQRPTAGPVTPQSPTEIAQRMLRKVADERRRHQDGQDEGGHA